MRYRLVAAALAAATLTGSALPSVAGTPRPSAGSGYVSGSTVGAQGGPIHGIILTDAAKPFDVTLADINRLADDGVNMVTFYVTYYFSSPTASTISSGPMTPSDTEVTTAIDMAHSAGLAVQIDPILWASGKFVYRGALYPADMTKFWASYSKMILHYATIAQSTGTELLGIGSENKSLERYTKLWQQLAASVRQVYDGRLTYMALTQSVNRVKFWHSLDYIGISPYYYLSGSLNPSYAELRAAWNKWMPMLKAVSLRIGRPMLFNEIGYLSALGTTADPWVATSNQPTSQTIQANAYAALLDAAKSQSWLAGIVWYAWSPPVLPLDKSFSPRDKRAECVMAQHWAAPTAPRLADGQPVNCLGAEIASTLGLQ